MQEKNVLGKLLKAASVIAAVYAGIVALGRYMAGKAKKLEEQNDGNPSKKYLIFMNGRNIKLGKEPVSEIDVKSFIGGVELDLSEAEITKDVDIRLHSVMGGINIKVPPMVRVILDGTNIMGGFANLVPSYDSDKLPIIFVLADNIMGGIAVQMAEEEEK